MNEYLFLGIEEKNGKFRIYLAKAFDGGMKPVMAYSDMIGLYYPTCESNPGINPGKTVLVSWRGIGKIESISQKA